MSGFDKRRIADYLEIAGHFALGCLPISACSGIGCVLGRILGPRHQDVNQRLRDNIMRLRPDITSKKQLNAMIKRSWGNYGRVMAEYSVLHRIWRSNRVQTIGDENVTHALKSTRPIIVIFLHLGNWEAIGPRCLELMGERFVQVYQMIDDKNKLYLANKVRHVYANHLIPNTPNAAKKIYNKLKEGYTVSLAVDEFIHNQLNTPSFGRPINLSSNLAYAVRFAQLTNAVLLPIYSTRTTGARFSLHIEAPVFFDFNKANRQTLSEMVTELDQRIDPIIRQHIDQWYYAHALNL